jgi:hypothetical protein
MAKSLRAHCKRRARTLMRQTVGKRQEDKVLRKVTRRTAHALLAGGDKSEADVLALLSGVGGGSRHLVTLQPRKRRALPFHFNSNLRAVRVASGLEDDTDSEEEADGTERVNEKGEPARGEPVPTGAAAPTGGNAGFFMASGGGSGGGGGGAGSSGEGMGEEGEEEEELEGDLDEGEDVVEQSGRKMAADKPVGKRDMSDRFYEWAQKDLINPHVSGFYPSELPLGKKAAAKAARKAKSKVRGGGGRSTFIPVHKK